MHYSDNRNTLYKSVFKHRRLKSHKLICDLAANCNRAASWLDKTIPCQLSLCFPAANVGWQKCQVGGRRESQSVADRPGSVYVEVRQLRLQTFHCSLKKGLVCSIPSLNPEHKLCLGWP